MIYIIFKFIADNYLSIFSLLCLLFIAFGDKRLGLQERRFVAFFVVSIALLCLNDYIDYTIGHIPHSQYWWIRSIASTICYIIRPIILFAELHLVGNLSKRLYIIAFILLAFNTFIFATSFWTQWTFIINSDNIFIRGPLGLLSHIIAIFFMTILIISILKKHNDLDTMEQLALLFLNISITLGAIIDSITYNNSLHLTIVLAFIIYYLIVYVHHSNKVLNAREEELEAKRNALMLSQIHPHFIYNTLNVIYYLCRTDSQKAANAVLNFSEYLHTTLEFSLENNLIPIEKELELARNYTYLEKIRFEDLEIIFDIQDEGYMIPPLSIQPIVENAIRHGVHGMKDGTVTIFLYLDSTSTNFPNGCHVIKISDNGNGISKEHSNLGKHKGVGIQNVKTRIEEITLGTFEIVMTPDSGTTVTIRIPIA